MKSFDIRVATDGSVLNVLSVTEVMGVELPVTKIVFIGDSNTAPRPANGVSQAQTYSQLVGDARGFTQVINAGTGGQTSAQMLARFDADVLAHNPDHVCIDPGVNGVMASQTVAQYEADTRAMVQKCVDADVPVTLSTCWLVKTTAYINAMDPFMDKIRLVAADFNIPLVDVYEAVMHEAWKTGNAASWYAMYVDDQHQSVAGHSFRASVFMRAHNWRGCKLPA